MMPPELPFASAMVMRVLRVVAGSSVGVPSGFDLILKATTRFPMETRSYPYVLPAV